MQYINFTDSLTETLLLIISQISKVLGEVIEMVE